ncbi:MAG: MMPL family transporter [Flavobacteriales bacterium]|nr:MMPL family transporter [Flavobacteriales bacterium]
MWAKIGAFILRQRIPLGIFMLLVSGFMAWESQYVRMSYKFGGILPEDDSTYVEYQKFINQFSEDGNVLAIGYRDEKIWELQNFNRWRKLVQDLKSLTVDVDGVPQHMVDSVFSTGNCYNLEKDTLEQKFKFAQIIDHDPDNQQQLDSIRDKLYSLPFYKGLLYQDSTNAGLMMVFVNAKLFNSENRGDAIDRMIAMTDQFTADTGIKTYVSGMPFIRSVMSVKVKKELKFFTILSALICMVLLFTFFRSVKVTLVVMSVVVFAVVIAMGTIALFDYPITMLMGLIPPLMIVTTVPNCIYLVTKYHQEYKRYGNKTRALTRVVQKAGAAAFMINATTAVGFATFIFTSSDLLKHFGVIASLNCMLAFFLSLLVFPIVYSFLPPPTDKHLGHLDSPWLEKVLDGLVRLVMYKRKIVYLVTILCSVIGLYGISLMHTTGNIVDDIPDSDRVITDLKWFETNFNGVMPFEILVDGQKKGQITKEKNLQKIEELQTLLSAYELKVGDTLIKPFSRSLSIVDAGKYIKQAYYDGDPEFYSLMARDEQSFIAPYLKKDSYQSNGVEKTFLDSTKSMTRITTQIADIGTLEMDRMMSEIKPQIDSIFDPAKYKVTLTGTSVVFLEGTNYLVGDLFSSLLFGVLIISIMMAFMFWSARMVFISFIPNIIPQILTAGIMGFMNIPLKPSTILVFSIALGITVDNTIHYLAKYRQELKFHDWKIRDSALLAIRETGASMVYTSLILLFGFGCFAASEFEGTRALGILTAVTLLVAMFTNLLVLPALLLSFQRSVTTKSFKEPFFQMTDEEDDLHYGDWEIKKIEMSAENQNQ